MPALAMVSRLLNMSWPTGCFNTTYINVRCGAKANVDLILFPVVSVVDSQAHLFQHGHGTIDKELCEIISRGFLHFH